jgi:hypothetical protein
LSTQSMEELAERRRAEPEGGDIEKQRLRDLLGA